jgi:hypothetical protein
VYLVAVEQRKIDDTDYYGPWKLGIIVAGGERGRINPRKMVQRALGIIALVLHLDFQIYPVTVHQHVYVQPAKLLADFFRRHFGVGYRKIADAFERDFKQYGDEPLQQVRVSHKQHLEKHVAFEGVFQFCAFFR